jgi:hypothetical protein
MSDINQNNHGLTTSSHYTLTNHENNVGTISSASVMFHPNLNNQNEPTILMSPMLVDGDDPRINPPFSFAVNNNNLNGVQFDYMNSFQQPQQQQQQQQQQQAPQQLEPPKKVRKNLKDILASDTNTSNASNTILLNQNLNNLIESNKIMMMSNYGVQQQRTDFIGGGSLSSNVQVLQPLQQIQMPHHQQMSGGDETNGFGLLSEIANNQQHYFINKNTVIASLGD